MVQPPVTILVGNSNGNPPGAMAMESWRFRARNGSHPTQSLPSHVSHDARTWLRSRAARARLASSSPGGEFDLEMVAFPHLCQLTARKHMLRHVNTCYNDMLRTISNKTIIWENGQEICNIC